MLKVLMLVLILLVKNGLHLIFYDLSILLSRCFVNFTQNEPLENKIRNLNFQQQIKTKTVPQPLLLGLETVPSAHCWHDDAPPELKVLTLHPSQSVME